MMKMKWISVKDKLPPEDEWIILSKTQGSTFGVFIAGKFFNPDLNYLLIADVTHWMPLPSPYKEET